MMKKETYRIARHIYEPHGLGSHGIGKNPPPVAKISPPVLHFVKLANDACALVSPNMAPYHSGQCLFLNTALFQISLQIFQFKKETREIG